VVPTRGVARLGTTCVTPGHAMLAHGPNQLIAYTDREYRMLFASMPDRRTTSVTSQLPATSSALRSGAGMTVLRLSENDATMFHRYVHGALQPQSRECNVLSSVSTWPALDTPLVNLCESWLRNSMSCGPARVIAARYHAAIRARQYIDAHLDQALTMASVCHASYSSPRALQYAFQEIFGVSPKKYIRCARLSRVRCELNLSTKTYGRVTQLATKWGLWHLSRFSSDYYEQFGELPSVTLGRATARRDRPESIGRKWVQPLTTECATESIDVPYPERLPSIPQCSFDGGNDLVRRAGLQQYGVEKS
jgi:AraC-like DNA-binding protein